MYVKEMKLELPMPQAFLARLSSINPLKGDNIAPGIRLPQPSQSDYYAASDPWTQALGTASAVAQPIVTTPGMTPGWQPEKGLLQLGPMPGTYTQPRLDIGGDLQGFAGAGAGIPQQFWLSNRAGVQPMRYSGMGPWSAINNHVLTPLLKYMYDKRPGIRTRQDVALGTKERQYKPSIGYQTRKLSGG